jgi:G3E family GTPase
VRTDMQETLRELFSQRRAGLMIDFDRVVIETTGLADPAPVIQTLVSDTLLEAHYRLDGVVTLVDAVNGGYQLASQPEAIKQIALADRIFITKTDISTQATMDELTQSVMGLNPSAKVSFLLNGEIDPYALMNLGLGSARAGQRTLQFLGESSEGDDPRDGPHDDSPKERYLGTKRAKHDPAIATLSLRFEKPFSWTAFSSALDLLSSLRGPDLLRVKGIVNVDGKPVVVQGVQHIFHPPVSLDRWPSADTDSRLVFITRNISADTIRGLFLAVTSLA